VRMKIRTHLIVLICLGLACFMNPRLVAQTLDDPLELIVLAKPRKPAEPYKKQYDFHKDWDYFTYNIPIWDIALSSYKGRPDLSYLEIGVLEGRSAVWMLENVLTHPTSKLTAIDLFVEVNRVSGEDIKQRFISNVKVAEAEGRTTLIVGYSQVELRKFPSIPLISYISMDHTSLPTFWRMPY